MRIRSRTAESLGVGSVEPAAFIEPAVLARLPDPSGGDPVWRIVVETPVALTSACGGSTGEV